MSLKVSIIMPVFNGENYLRGTLDSLLAQSYSNWEAICVDDSSTDSSFDILQQYAQKDSRFVIFQKKNEKIAAKGVVYGLKYATGEYFMYSSQDDLFSCDLLEKNVEKAIETNANYVLPVMKWYYGENDIRDGYYGFEGEISKELTGRDALILSLNWQIHGFGLIIMSLVKETGWFDYGYDSDEYTTRVLLLNSNKVVFSEGIFFYRQNNPNSITHKFSVIQFDAINTCFKLEDLLSFNNFSNENILFMRKITCDKIIRSTKNYFRYKSQISFQEKKEIKKLLKNSFNNLNKRFLISDEANKKTFQNFRCFYSHYLILELRRSNRFFIKFFNILHINSL